MCANMLHAGSGQGAALRVCTMGLIESGHGIGGGGSG